MNIETLRTSGFRIEEHGFERLVLWCTRCGTAESVVVVRTRTPTETQLREALGALRMRHGCKHTTTGGDIVQAPPSQSAVARDTLRLLCVSINRPELADMITHRVDSHGEAHRNFVSFEITADSVQKLSTAETALLRVITEAIETAKRRRL